MGGINAMKGRKPPPPAPRMQEMRALVGFGNARAKFKETYFVVPPEGVSFCAVPTALLESAVWKTLGINERRFVDAIHVAHSRAGGRKNGCLTLTHKQLKRMGIHGDRINPVIENLVVSGLLQVTHRGGPADPSRYRVTYLPHCIEEPNGRVVFYPPGRTRNRRRQAHASRSSSRAASPAPPPAKPGAKPLIVDIPIVNPDRIRSISRPISGAINGPVDDSRTPGLPQRR
jgi:hypothetical protein